jgi:hypothetical protein
MVGNPEGVSEEEQVSQRARVGAGKRQMEGRKEERKERRGRVENLIIFLTPRANASPDPALRLLSSQFLPLLPDLELGHRVRVLGGSKIHGEETRVLGGRRVFGVGTGVLEELVAPGKGLGHKGLWDRMCGQCQWWPY